jgi:hypothetical protein
MGLGHVRRRGTACRVVTPDGGPPVASASAGRVRDDRNDACVIVPEAGSLSLPPAGDDLPFSRRELNYGVGAG